MRQRSGSVRAVVRPTFKATPEQKRLLAAVIKAIDHAAEVADKEAAKIWSAAQRARESGIPDTQIVRATGINRATMNRVLGPRKDTKK